MKQNYFQHTCYVYNLYTMEDQIEVHTWLPFTGSIT